MKKLAVMIGCLCFSACSIADGNRETQADEDIFFTKEFKNEYPLNQVACREKDLSHVDDILQLAGAVDSKGAILYFHGGLSDQDYVQKDLGPKLMQTIFNDKNRDGIYPVFVNYDADIFDKEKFRQLRQFNNSELVFYVIEKIKSRLSREKIKLSDKNLHINQDDDSIAARAILADYLPDKTNVKALLEEPSQEEVKQLSKMLTKEKYLEKLADDMMAKDIKANDLLFPAGVSSKFIDEKSIDPKLIYKVTAKILLRIALGSNHQIAPTVIEELLRSYNPLGLTTFAQDHWKMVYRHGNECWGVGSEGERLIKGLLKIRSEKKMAGLPFTISTVSHSAGSIPTAYLLNMLKKGRNEKIDNVMLIAPALHQKLFIQAFVDHQAFDVLKAYVLQRESEEKDNLAGIVYPASLLYFVSGIAEEKGHGDRMLLLEQHLSRDKKPYKYSTYLKLVKEKPKAVWDFFDRYAKDESALVYYPNQQMLDHDDNADTHECTKYPWAARDLALDILRVYTGSSKGKTLLPVPAGAKTCNK